MSKTKKLCSLLLAVIMLVSMIQLPVNAALISGKDKAEIALVTMVEDPTATYGYSPEAIDLYDATAGDAIYIGILAKNLNNIEEMNAKIGLSQFETGFWYDPTYVAPYRVGNNFKNDAEDLITLNDSTQGDYIFGYDEDGYTYEVSTSLEDGIDGGDADGTGAVKYTVTWGAVGEKRPVFNPSDEEILGILKFKVVSVPTDKSGTTVFGMSNDASKYTLDIGFDGTDSNFVQYQLLEATPDVLITNVINYTFTGVDVFPAVHTVTYSSNNVTVSTESVSNNGSATKIPQESDLTEAHKVAGKFFDGWYYDATGANFEANATTVFDGDVDITADTTVFAKWIDGKTITFNTNYASTHTIDNLTAVNDTQDVVIAPTETVIAHDNGDVPTVGGTGADFRVPDGHAFAGWYKDAACSDGQEFVFDDAANSITGTTVADGDQVYAKWVAQVDVKFYENYDPDSTGTTKLVATYQVPTGGSLDATQVSDLDTHEPDRTADKYSFAGWNTETNGSGTTYVVVSNKLVEKDDNTKEATFSAETPLYAVWETSEADKVTLTFDPNGQSVTVNPSTVTVNKDDTIYKIQIPVVADTATHHFDGWFESAAITDTTPVDFVAGKKMTENDTVFAHWTYTGTDAVTVNFYDDETNTTTPYATAVVAPKSTLGAMMPGNPSKTGYSFKEWNTATQSAGGGTTFDGTTSVGGNSGGAATTLNIYAHWTRDITVRYMENMTDEETPTPDFETTQPAGDLYKEPTAAGITDSSGNTYTAPTRTGYKLVGWNTARNGSGTYVAADGIETYSTVSGGITPLELWAQWAAVPDSEIPYVISGTPADPDPATNGVKVTFDSNDAGHTPKATPANPLYKYPKLNDAIGTYNMPKKPTSTNYTFAGWNTKQDGSGIPVEVTGETPIDVALGATAIAGTTTSYEITLYAQWTVKDQTNKATIIFDSNLNGKMDGNIDSFDTVDVHPNDSMGYELSAKPTNGQYTFDKWVLADGTAFTSSTTVSADTTVYATWTRSIIAKISDKTAPYQYPYANAIISPAWALYENVVDGTGTLVEKPIDSTDINVADIVFKYLTDADDPSTATDLKEIGTYYADAEPGPNLGAGLGITVSIPDFEIKVVSKGLNFTVDTSTQKQKVDAPPTGLTIETTDATGLYTVEYYLWNNDGDALVETNELQLVTDNADIIGAAAKPESYVVKIVLTDSTRYHIETVTAKDGTSTIATVNHDTTAFPTGNYAGQNLSYIIEPNDPSLNSVTITSGVNDKTTGVYTSSGAVTLRANTSPYAATSFVTGPTGVDTTTKTANYLVQVNTATDTRVQFTIEPTADSTVLTVPTPVTGVTISGDATSGWVITVDRNIDTGIAADPDDDIMLVTDVSIVTKAGTASDAPTYTYNFIILGDARIALEYGNSPYGEIMKDNVINKDDARTYFNTNHKFESTATPSGAQVGRTYVPYAWNTDITATTVPEDPAINMDRNEHAIFVYQGEDFVDPGFKVYNSRNEEVTGVELQIESTVDVMADIGTANIKDSVVTPTKLISVEEASGYKFTELTDKFIKPGVYDIIYSYTDPYTDEAVTKTRKMVMLWEIADANLSALVNGSDITTMTSILKKATKPIDGVTTDYTAGIYYFRILDVNESMMFNGSDSTTTTSILKKAIPSFRIYSPLQ